MADHCGRMNKSWQTDGGVARRWHHVVECGWCHGTGIYSHNASCSCGHWVDDCPEARVVAEPAPVAPPARETAPGFQQSALFELETAS